MLPFLCIVATLIGVGSWLFVSQATLGVAGIAFACLLAVLARIAQADAQHKEVLKRTPVPAA